MSAPRKRRVVLLGSTGSIGTSTLKVARELPERIELIALAAGTNASKLAEQALETGVKHVAIHDASKEAELRALLPDDVTIHVGAEGLVALAELFRRRSSSAVLAYSLGWAVVMVPWLGE